MQVEPIKNIKIMNAIKVKNAPKSMIMVLVENDNRFVFNRGDIFVMGTSNVEKFKKYIKTKGMSSSEIDSLSYEVVEIDNLSDVYDF